MGGSIEEELLPEYVEPEIQNDGNLQIDDPYSVSFFVSSFDISMNEKLLGKVNKDEGIMIQTVSRGRTRELHKTLHSFEFLTCSARFLTFASQ